MANKATGGSRKRAAEGEPSEGKKKSVEDILQQYQYEEPKEDDKTSKFSQLYISKPAKALIIYSCDSCQELAASFSKDVRCGELPVLCVPMCRACISTNRKVSQNLFFGLALKNMTESLAKTKTD